MSGQALGQVSLIGLKLGHYRIANKIGSGGMGEVYLAHDEHLDRKVAIKVLPPGTLADNTSRKRFRKEALALSKLSHPNIEIVHDFDTQEGVDFLVMEYLPGQTLDALLTAPLADKEIIHLGSQLAEGLAAAHEHGVLHRDVKPGNMRVAPNGQLKILDFGLAKLIESSASTDETETSSMSDGVVGTLPYAPPEQLRSEKVDARSDIWSAGAVLYEMATGRRPFAGNGPSLVDAIFHQQPAPPSTHNRKVSPALDAIILKCLEKDPENRYHSAHEIVVDLHRLSIPSSNLKLSRQSWPRRRIALSLLAIIMVGLLGALFLSRTGRVHALTDKDTVVLADVDNKTGDAIFDDALKQALAVELGQSPFLNVLSSRKVSEALAMMGRPANERITPDVSRELCLRTGSKAVVSGTISRLGSHYLVGLNAVACSSGDTLAKEQGEAASDEDVLKTLGRASTRLRAKLGESLPSVQKFDVPIEATTSSLEALKNYSIASNAYREQGEAPSIPFYKRAIELDPNFPMAYADLAIAYGNLGQSSLALECATKAYQLRDRVMEREKFRIAATYFFATGELDKEAQTYEVWKANYPRDKEAHGNLCVNYLNLGQYQKGLPECQQSLTLGPDDVSNYSNLGAAYLGVDRLDEAKAIFDQAFAHKLDSEFLRWNIYSLAFLRGDSAQMAQQVVWAMGKPGDEELMLLTQSHTEAYYGRIRSARDFSRRAVNSATRAGFKESAALWQVGAALQEAELGNIASATQGATAALALSTGRDVKMAAALALARSGEVSRANTLATELAKKYPTDTLLQFYWLPTIKAAIELNRGHPSQALVDLEPAASYELGEAGFINNLYPVYVRGQAYLLAHNGTAAAAEFQKMLDHKSIVVNFVTGALAHLQIARAYVMAGDTGRAKAAYLDLLTLWKDADPDLPILKKAQAEYAKLQ